MPIALPVSPEANELLSRNALALLIGMLLDQQVPFERAFSAPADLAARLGHEPTAEELADYNPEALTAIFSQRPALHRFPKAMAARVQALARIIVDEYDGDAATMWAGAPSGAELLRRVSALPGFGTVKAQIFVALLGKQLGVQPPGWREASGPFGLEGSYVSVADITDDDSLARVRSYKQSLKAAAKAAGRSLCERYGLLMKGREQMARLLPLAVVLLLAVAGLRGRAPWPRWDGPLKAYGVAIGIALEVILLALLAATYYRDHIDRRDAVPAPATAGDDDDRDVALALRVHLRVLLGASMAAIATILLLNLHLHLFHGKTMPARLKMPPYVPRSPRPGPPGASTSIPLGPILYGLLIAVLLAALVLSIWWARRLGNAIALPGGAGDDLAEEPEGLREAVASGRAAMTNLDDARAAIIACYEAMEQSLAERGAARGVAGTPDELLRRAIDRDIVHDAAARRLTALFYEARFSSHPLGPGTRDAAVRALDDLAADLGGVAAGSGAAS